MTTFHHLSALALAQAAEFFEHSFPEADVDLLEDILTITLPEGGQYVINRHGVTQQIWVSSPFTGAHHFAYYNNDWKNTRTSLSLADFLRQEGSLYAART